MQTTNLALKLPSADQLKALQLTAADIDASLSVHAMVRKKLLSAADPQPHFLKPVSKENVAELLLGGGKLLGIQDENGLLLAKNHLSFPKEPIPESVKKDFPGVDLSNVARISGFASNKEGIGLATMLLEFNKQVAVEEGVSAIVSKVALANQASLRTFAKAGFELVATGVDTKRDVLDADYEFGCFRWPTPTL